MESLKEGMKAPQFKAIDAFGNEFTSDSLIGKTTVIFFYPKDMTPGCTKEACGFQEQFKAFEDNGVQIIGISPDGQNSHKKFIDKYNLQYTLLCDTDAEICKKFGIFKEKTLFGIKALGVERSTFVIDKNGIIVLAEKNVKVEGHVANVLEFINKQQNKS
jgi:peroxiredoxin Q/BCP